MCIDYVNGCQYHEKLRFHANNCDYLPPLGGNVNCFYEYVWCSKPPTVNNAEVKTFFSEYGVRAEYTCHNGFQMMGDKNVTCMKSGRWSKAPYCSAAPKHTVQVTKTTSTESSLIPTIITSIDKETGQFRTKPTAQSTPEAVTEPRARSTTESIWPLEGEL